MINHLVVKSLKTFGNPFYFAGLYLYPLTVFKNLCFSDIFMEYRKKQTAKIVLSENELENFSSRITFQNSVITMTFQSIRQLKN